MQIVFNKFNVIFVFMSIFFISIGKKLHSYLMMGSDLTLNATLLKIKIIIIMMIMIMMILIMKML